MMMQSVATYAYQVEIPTEQLPAAVIHFVQSNFPHNGIVSAMVEIDDTQNAYLLMLRDGTKMEFDSNGKLLKIYSKE